MDHNMTARLAHADTSISQPRERQIPDGGVKMRYIHSPATAATRRRATARCRWRNWRVRNNEGHQQRGQIGGRKIHQGNDDHARLPDSQSTVAVSEIGRDFQNRMLRSLRSAYRQSSRYQVEYMRHDGRRTSRRPDHQESAGQRACSESARGRRNRSIWPNRAASSSRSAEHRRESSRSHGFPKIPGESASC